jgi:hypothetical protein
LDLWTWPAVCHCASRIARIEVSWSVMPPGADDGFGRMAV